MDDHVGDVLGAEGPFAREVPGFVPREVQMAMAEAVAAAIDERHTLIAEAGTGTGKTFAYLVPALLSGKRVIVSTGTKALQDQLFHRDLPRVRSVLGARLSAALLKGRANYLCLHRLEQARTEGQFASRQQVSDLQRIHAWSTSTRHGDRAELAELAEDSPLWPRVTSTTDNCLGSECAFFNDCFVVKARRAAQEADVVVVNHHLLFADLAIKQEGFGEILPGAHAFILDEAHQVPELAGQFFSVSLSARQLAELVRDTIAECGSVTGVLGILQPLTEAITTAVRKLRLAMDGFPGRAALKRIERDAEVEAGIEALRLALEALVNGLAPHNERSRGLDSVHERAQSALARLNQLMDGSARDSVHWYELSAQGFSLHSTPLDLAQPLRELREQSHAAWIFTSATLSIAGDFTHFARQLGLDDPHTVCLQSPFDYQRQALAYLPAGLPEPNTDTHTERVVEAVIPVLAASQGRAFLLFTSHRALRRAAELLADRVPWPLFVQGSAPRHQLLEEFRASGNGVLLGAASFWEGVDVAGDALSVVVIDKLPFAAPDDPVLAARLETLREAGLKPFFDWQIPNAVIALKQGAGRLIRDIHDRGVLVLCDPRLTSKGYGRIFLASLPDMPRTTDIGAVQAFFGA
ncbi:MAG TPA: ATP-dependent DNA helicase [Dokdonella sp.]|jgi:ATP-dependent DNA helicase DinG|uniref:ATP-dependent DNA helicase n=1 Tax=Dokdonella sp. TaxID=2291710 RepID=UPI002BBF3DBB|nr:ATP-dependent DNA helicase [Dokdonella sp.]HNV09438.1 ATP-dependent DNA helicase [Dokdonella sp.]HPW04973.1 ATP-dependent DNA helicase [Dokdonella sp.]